MAILAITHTWPDGSVTELQVSTEDGYPDAMAEGVATIVKLWRETCQAHDA